MNSSPRSHNVRAAGAGAARACPSSSGGVRLGGRRSSSLFQGGRFLASIVCLLSPEFRLEARGCACLGTPDPIPLSVCLSLCCCLSLGVLAYDLTVNVDKPILDVPRTNTASSVQPPVPRLPLANSLRCCYLSSQEINTLCGSRSTWAPVSLGPGA